jgi:fructose-specific phosphotransferase system IIA component
MNLLDIYDPKVVKFDLDVSDKKQAIKEVTKIMFDAGKINDIVKFEEAILEREKNFPTGIGYGLAIPHCISDSVNEVSFSFIKLKNEIEWGSLDDKNINIIIMLTAKMGNDSEHLKLLSKLATLLMDDEFRENLFKSNCEEEVFSFLERKCG